jgi:hypothetical protein
MSFVEKVLSGEYPQIEKLWRREFEKVIDKVFSQDFEELANAVEPGRTVAAESPACGCDCQRQIREQWDRLEATRRELDLAKLEKATLQYKLDCARRELQT